MSGPRYRDADGDVWEEQPSGMLVGVGEASIAAPGTRESIENRYGPLTAIPETRKSVRNEIPNPQPDGIDAAIAYAQSVAKGIDAEEARLNATAYFDGDTPEVSEAVGWTGAPQHAESRREMTADDVARAVHMWAERFQTGDRWDPEDMRDLEAALGGTVEAHPTAHRRRQMIEATLLGGPFDLSTFNPPHLPARVLVAGCIYVQITDPDTGDGLGAYAFDPTGKR